MVRRLSRLLQSPRLGLVLMLLAVGGTSTVAAAEAKPKITIALFGDSISRAVIADRNLGQEASEADQQSLAQFQLIAPLYPYSPENFTILNYGLMGAFDFVIRDQYGAVQGDQPYSLTTRLLAKTGRQVDVMKLAHLGGSYREADTQLALFKTELAQRNLANADVAFVDLGRADFSLFPPVEEFRAQVEQFFAGLLAASPTVRIVVNRIANEVQIIDRPDRLAIKIPGRGEINCRQMLGDTVTLGRSGLNVGQDNSKLLPEAVSRYNAYNQVLLDTVAKLRQAGAVVAWVSTLPDRKNPEDWDKIFAYDCVHINVRGQEEIADVLLPAVEKVLAEPTKPVSWPVPAGSELSAKGQQLWQSYLQTLPLEQLQDGCKPELLAHQEGTAYVGVAVLVHSFTGCPKELHDTADRLRAKGYTVVLPLLPGHGLRARPNSQGELRDNLSSLPLPRLGDSRSYRTVYNGFAATLDEIAAEFGGQRIVAGASLGATVANAMTQLRPYLWQRQLLLSPFYEPNNFFERAAFDLITAAGKDDEAWWTRFGPLLAERKSWGVDCEQGREELALTHTGDVGGRAGYCQYTVGQALAASSFGRETWQLLQPTTIKTQVIGAAGSGVASPDPVFNGIGRMRNEQLGLLPFQTEQRLVAHPDVRLCYTDASHDQWLQSAQWTSRMVDFLAAGTFVADSANTEVYGDPRCSD